MNTTTASLPATLLINSFHTQVEWFDVLSETEKAVFIRNQYSKKTAWIRSCCRQTSTRVFLSL